MALMAYAESGAQPNFTDRAMALAWSALCRLRRTLDASSFAPADRAKHKQRNYRYN